MYSSSTGTGTTPSVISNLAIGDVVPGTILYDVQHFVVPTAYGRPDRLNNTELYKNNGWLRLALYKCHTTYRATEQYQEVYGSPAYRATAKQCTYGT